MQPVIVSHELGKMTFCYNNKILGLSGTFIGRNEHDIEKICRILNKVSFALNHSEFKNAVENFKYYKEYTTGRLWWKKIRSISGNRFLETDMTNKEVYEYIIGAAETLNPEVNNFADMSIVIDESRQVKPFYSSVLGYTYGIVNEQFIYRWFFNSGSDEKIAENIVHEWLHKMGFQHAYYDYMGRIYTVPYAIGKIVSEIIRKHYK